MPIHHPEPRQCKFCSGRLRHDSERKLKMPGFLYYRCEDCDLSNVFSAQQKQPVFPLR